MKIIQLEAMQIKSVKLCYTYLSVSPCRWRGTNSVLKFNSSVYQGHETKVKKLLVSTDENG